ncbi:MAG: DNA alkylation repair protein [Bacteroidia bacterium]
MNEYTKYLSEVESSLLAIAGVKPGHNNAEAQRYINTKLDVIGISTPVVRNLARQGFSFSNIELQEQLLTWDHIWKTSAVHDAKTQAYFFVELNYSKFEQKKLWEVIRHWVKQVDNWAHSDSLSKIYTRILEAEEEIVYSQLVKWNRSKELWERRQSLVACLYYAKTKKKHLSYEKIISLVEPLLSDKAYYVQKGIGWTLRELRQAHTAKADRFISKNLGMISPVAFTAAIEHLGKEEKEQLKQKRKSMRR